MKPRVARVHTDFDGTTVYICTPFLGEHVVRVERYKSPVRDKSSRWGTRYRYGRAKVNWAAIESQSPCASEAFAKAILFASQIARRLDRGEVPEEGEEFDG